MANKTMKIKMCKNLEVDINSGFNKVVEKSFNEMLVNLQTQDGVLATDIQILQPVIDGRKVYLTISYMKEMQVE